MGSGDLRERVGRWTLANQLTFLRLVAVPFFVLGVLEGRFALAFWIFVGAAATDLLDGLIARALRQRSPLGAYLDPAADKILLTAAFVLLTEYPHMFREIAMASRIPVWLTTLVISRDVFIVTVSALLHVAYGRTRFTPTWWGKATTVAEIVTVALVLHQNERGRPGDLLRVAIWTTLVLVVASGLHYLAHTVSLVRREGAGPPAAGA